MIMLVSFNGLERSLFEKASEELGIARRIRYLDGISELLSVKSGPAEQNIYPRAVVMNIDSSTCLSDLQTIKSTNNWRKIPVIGYGFLENESDITTFYGNGGASCIRKPSSYVELVETTRAALGYWLSLSTLPCDYLREA